MRPYRLSDETLDAEDEGYPTVVPIAAGGRNRTPGNGFGTHAEPWTPRTASTPAAGPRTAPPSPALESSFSRTHRWMLAGFLVISIGMILGMVMVRVWDEASRAVASLPPEGANVSAKPAGESARPPASEPVPPQPQPQAQVPAPPAPEGAGAVTTEIRILQPNYTVAPGDTLGIIARRHGTSVEALASINNLENRNSLSIGQKLIIP
ncbi:MAG: LysM peptidoglycan-binding domain-containing protein [Chloroflexota bacterium]